MNAVTCYLLIQDNPSESCTSSPAGFQSYTAGGKAGSDT